jgi:hypothetical protein
MPTTTTTLTAFLGATGLVGVGGLVIYAADGTTVVLAHTTAGITQIGSSRSYQMAGVTLSLDTEYRVVWDDGTNDLPAQTVFLASGVNVITVNGSAVKVGNGVAAAVAAGTLTLDSTDAYRAANLAGWTIEVLSATTGAGQVATIASSNISTFVQTLAANWGTTPTGTINYKLTPPLPTMGGGADTPGTTTLVGLLTSTRAGYLDNLSAGAVAQASALATVATAVGTPAQASALSTLATAVGTPAQASALASVATSVSGMAAATVTAFWASAGHLGDGSKTTSQTMSKWGARLSGKMDTTTTPGTAIFHTMDGTLPAYTQVYSAGLRADHAPGSGF